MPKKTGIIFVTLGVVLILSALLLFLYNGYEDRLAGQEAELLLSDIQSIISARVEEQLTDTTVGSESSSAGGEWGSGDLKDVDDQMDGDPEQETLSPEMPTIQIKEYEYIGILSIPVLELNLPVMAQWDYTRLRIAPCRHEGSSRTDDLVIAAHNYNTHFGNLAGLEAGAEVIFTDMDGIVNRYALVAVPEILPPNAVDEVLNSGHDLVLYTCTKGGATRVVAFFDRISEWDS